MRETKYNLNPSSRKAPINKEALWSKIKTDPEFPIQENKNRKRFWIFGGLGLLLLLVVAAIAWPTLTKNNITTQNNISGNILKNEQNELVKNENNISQAIEVSSNSDELEKDLKNEIETVITPTQEKTQITQPQTLPAAKESSTDIGPEPTPNLIQSHFNPITTVQHNQSTIENEVIPSSNNAGGNKEQTQNLLGLQTQLNPITTLDQLDFSLDLPLADKVKDYQEELTDVKSKIGLLAYANVSYGLSMHNVEVNEKDSNDLDPNVTDYLKNRESRAIEIGVKKTLLKRFRLGLGGEFRQDWQAYSRIISEQSVARDSMLIAAGYSQQITHTIYTLHQKYQSLNLNLSLDYAIPLGKANLEVGGGLAYRLGMTTKGKVLDIENRQINRVDSYPIAFNENVSAFSQLGLTIPLNKDWRLSLNTRYNFPTLLTPEREDYSHKLSAVRLGMAIAYEF